MNKSFSMQVKTEILRAQSESPQHEHVFLSAVSHTAGSLVITEGSLSLVITIEDDGSRAYVYKIICETYGKSQIELSKRDIIVLGSTADKLLSDCGILSKGYMLRAGIEKKLINSDSAKTAYVRGAFIGCGSVSVKKGYHLELSLSNKLLADDVINLFANFEIKGKALERNLRTVVYIKGAQNVSDALALLGASLAVLELNSNYVDRQIKQLANRRSNCDLANIDKSLIAYERQREAIQKLKADGSFKKLDIKLQEAGEARLANPDISLAEVARLLNLSKSGIAHRLDKIIEISEKL